MLTVSTPWYACWTINQTIVRCCNTYSESDLIGHKSGGKGGVEAMRGARVAPRRVLRPGTLESMFGPNGANTSWPRTPGTRCRLLEVLGSIAIGTSLNRQVLLARSVATMLPRLGSTRGDWRGRPHGWNVRTDKDLAPEVLCHH